MPAVHSIPAPVTASVTRGRVLMLMGLLLPLRSVQGQSFGCQSGIRYYRIYEAWRKDWAAARSACEGNARLGLETGSLASIRNAADSYKVARLGVENEDITMWIGATDSETEGDWKWVSTDETFYREGEGVTDAGQIDLWSAAGPGVGNYAVMSFPGTYWPAAEDGAASRKYLCELCEIPNPTARVPCAGPKTYMFQGWNTRHNWADALLACRDQAAAGHMGALATVRSLEEQTQVFDSFGENFAVPWIGATQSAVPGEWRWADNNELFYKSDGSFSQSFIDWRFGPIPYVGGDHQYPFDTDGVDYGVVYGNAYGSPGTQGDMAGWGNEREQDHEHAYICESCECVVIPHIQTYAKDTCRVQECEPGYAPDLTRDVCEPCDNSAFVANYGSECNIESCVDGTWMHGNSCVATAEPTSEPTAQPELDVPTPQVAPTPTDIVPTTESTAPAVGADALTSADGTFNPLWLLFLLLLLPSSCVLIAFLWLKRSKEQKGKTSHAYLEMPTDVELKDTTAPADEPGAVEDANTSEKKDDVMDL